MSEPVDMRAEVRAYLWSLIVSGYVVCVDGVYTLTAEGEAYLDSLLTEGDDEASHD